MRIECVTRCAVPRDLSNVVRSTCAARRAKRTAHGSVPASAALRSISESSDDCAVTTASSSLRDSSIVTSSYGTRVSHAARNSTATTSAMRFDISPP
jgi:hypothetical protein